MEQLANFIARTTIASDLSSGGTSLSVVSSFGFPVANFRVRIEDEIIKVTAISGTTWTIVRGIDGTTAVTHAAGNQVNHYLMISTLPAMQADMYMTDVYASRPASARPNAIYVATDANVLCRFNGTVWEEYGPVYPIVPPPNNFGASYSWYQQGSATFTQQGASWVLKVPAETTGAVRTVYKAAPATPYTIEVGMRFLQIDANYVGSGIIWKQSSNNAMIQFCIPYHSPYGTHAALDKFNNLGGFDSTYTPVNSSPLYSAAGYPEFFRIVDDGIYRKALWSVDGRNWIQYHFIVRFDYITANQIGFGVQTSNNVDAYLEIFHYKEF